MPTLLSPRQDHGCSHDQEKYTKNGPALNPEPEENPRIVLVLYPRAKPTSTLWIVLDEARGGKGGESKYGNET